MVIFMTIIIALIIIFMIIMTISFAGTMAGAFPIPPEKMISKKAWKNMQPRRKKLHEMETEEVMIKSHDGLNLVGHWIETPGAERTMLLCHGWRSRWDIDFSNSALWLHEQKCNLLLMEQRAQGKSEGSYMTFGIKERVDCRDWIDWCVKKDPEHPIFLYGTSMGAATVLMTCGQKLPEQVKAVIADSGFTSPYAIIRDISKRVFHAPLHPNMDIMELFSRVFAKVSLKEYSAIEAMKNCMVPVILIHGKADTFVPYYMSEENAAACSYQHKLHIFDDASHCGSYWKHTEEYQQILLQAFEEYET